jgi:hypothetical protein
MHFSKLSALLFCLIVFSSPTIAQSNSWKILADVRYETKKDPASQYELDFPIFGENVKALDGKKIALKGYIVPIDELLGQQNFVLSSLPFNLCFFCGGAGPETVIEVKTQEKIAYTEKQITVKGIFYINPSDPDHLMYRLENAVVE